MINYAEHETLIRQFLEELNHETTAFVLKGGTALRQCYGLDRISEDIDLDSTARNIIPFTEKFCRTHSLVYRIAKDTNTVKRMFISYGDNEGNRLKIEVSYRQKSISPEVITSIKEITVYSLDRLAAMKAAAYFGRDKIRDLYDITFICNNYFNELSESTKNILSDAFSYKGLEAFDYLIQTEQDPLIDKEKLAEDFLKTWDKLDLAKEKTETKTKKKKPDHSMER